MSMYATELTLTSIDGDGELNINRNLINNQAPLLLWSGDTYWGIETVLLDKNLATQLRDYLDRWINGTL